MLRQLITCIDTILRHPKSWCLKQGPSNPPDIWSRAEISDPKLSNPGNKSLNIVSKTSGDIESAVESYSGVSGSEGSGGSSAPSWVYEMPRARNESLLPAFVSKDGIFFISKKGFIQCGVLRLRTWQRRSGRMTDDPMSRKRPSKSYCFRCLDRLTIARVSIHKFLRAYSGAFPEGGATCNQRRPDKWLQAIWYKRHSVGRVEIGLVASPCALGFRPCRHTISSGILVIHALRSRLTLSRAVESMVRDCGRGQKFWMRCFFDAIMTHR